MHEYEYAMPAVTVDVVALAYIAVEGHEKPVPHVLVIKRGHEPYKGQWALPGGFAEGHERLEQSAVRELQEETGVFIGDINPSALVGVYSAPGRDPRGWVISTVYAIYVPDGNTKPVAGDDAEHACWMPVVKLKGVSLAFDHRDMIEDGLRRFGLAFPG